MTFTHSTMVRVVRLIGGEEFFEGLNRNFSEGYFQ
tara:strand:- start:1100 stop:1204 length:105 start_codon:yes stop_codon:yes gene_type:complete